MFGNVCRKLVDLRGWLRELMAKEHGLNCAYRWKLNRPMIHAGVSSLCVAALSLDVREVCNLPRRPIQ